MQVQHIAWEAIKQGYQEGEKQILRETILNVIIPDFRDLRMELRMIERFQTFSKSKSKSDCWSGPPNSGSLFRGIYL
ncbi:MAG TPA: hypothetical protein VI479_07715 [Blastocatellia bacterium]